MQTLIKKNHQSPLINSKLILIRLNEWRGEMKFWHSEIDHFLRLLKRKPVNTSAQSDLRFQFQLFRDSKIESFGKAIDNYEEDWKMQKLPTMTAIVDLNQKYEEIQDSYLQLQKQFRALKIKALKDLIKSYPIIIY